MLNAETFVMDALISLRTLWYSPTLYWMKGGSLSALQTGDQIWKNIQLLCTLNLRLALFWWAVPL